MYDRTDSLDDRVHNGLNALGREQARLTGARLAALPVRIAHLYASDFTRARETAAEIARTLRLASEEDSILHECTPSSDRADYMRDLSAAEIALCDSQRTAAWAKYMRPLSTPGDSHDVLVCHGNVIRWCVVRALGADTRRWTRMDIANGSVTIIAVRPDGTTRLVLYSDASHIPIAQQTWTGRGAGWKSVR
jgi:serine/threonine-protein phosphatase PGAM5